MGLYGCQSDQSGYSGFCSKNIFSCFRHPVYLVCSSHWMGNQLSDFLLLVSNRTLAEKSTCTKDGISFIIKTENDRPLQHSPNAHISTALGELPTEKSPLDLITQKDFPITNSASHNSCQDNPPDTSQALCTLPFEAMGLPS